MIYFWAMALYSSERSTRSADSPCHYFRKFPPDAIFVAVGVEKVPVPDGPHRPRADQHGRQVRPGHARQPEPAGLRPHRRVHLQEQGHSGSPQSTVMPIKFHQRPWA